MKYAGYMPNDFIDGYGVTVSLWTQGCPHRCPGCHNPETWDFNGGYEVPTDLAGQLIKAISANGIRRNFSVLGGEPLCPENIKFVSEIVSDIRTAYPGIMIFIWTGYELNEILTHKGNIYIDSILENVDIIIDGKYDERLKDRSLLLRGSSNQCIYCKDIDF